MQRHRRSVCKGRCASKANNSLVGGAYRKGGTEMQDRPRNARWGANAKPGAERNEARKEVRRKRNSCRSFYGKAKERSPKEPLSCNVFLPSKGIVSN